MRSWRRSAVRGTDRLVGRFALDPTPRPVQTCNLYVSSFGVAPGTGARSGTTLSARRKRSWFAAYAFVAPDPPPCRSCPSTPSSTRSSGSCWPRSPGPSSGWSARSQDKPAGDPDVRRRGDRRLPVHPRRRAGVRWQGRSGVAARRADRDRRRLPRRRHDHPGQGPGRRPDDGRRDLVGGRHRHDVRVRALPARDRDDLVLLLIAFAVDRPPAAPTRSDSRGVAQATAVRPAPPGAARSGRPSRSGSPRPPPGSPRRATG